jgi:hypothetical protein
MSGCWGIRSAVVATLVVEVIVAGAVVAALVVVVMEAAVIFLEMEDEAEQFLTILSIERVPG